MKRRKLTKLQRMAIYAKTDGRCAYCGQHILINGMQIDHVKPLKCGGVDTEDNMLPASFSVIGAGSWNGLIWDDVDRMGTMNSKQAKKDLQMHICPLQFDIVNRIIERYSNPGETVLDPFADLMTVPYCAVQKGRKGIGIELNYMSFNDGVKYLKDADTQISAPTLFDLEKAV